MNFQSIVNPGDKIIFLCKCGSHLYGTNTEKSDLDLKGIYIPSVDSMYLGRFKKSISANTNKSNTKNTSDDVDIELYSIQYFVELLKNGETIAIDMINANKENILTTSAEFEVLYNNRKFFYTKKMKAFVGYAKSQAIKYGNKGSRLKVVCDCLEILNRYSPTTRLRDILDLLPVTEHSYYRGMNANGLNEYVICNKVIQESVTVEYFQSILVNFMKTYGSRSTESMNNNSIDWKALSHAIRVCLELEEIYTTGDLKFPLKDAKMLTEIKYGKVDYNDVINLLEYSIEVIQSLCDASSFPESVTQKFCDAVILSIIHINTLKN